MQYSHRNRLENSFYNQQIIPQRRPETKVISKSLPRSPIKNRGASKDVTIYKRDQSTGKLYKAETKTIFVSGYEINESNINPKNKRHFRSHKGSFVSKHSKSTHT